MVEHAIQNDPHAPGLGFGAKGLEVLLRAQHGVDGPVVRRVVAVVGGGLKDGAEIQRGDAQRRQIVQLGGDARQRAAEEIPVANLAVRIGPPLWDIIPVFVDPAVSNQALRIRHFQTAESIWENLVSNAGTEPLGGAALPVDSHLPGVDEPVAAVAGFVQITAGAVTPPEAEVVPDQVWLVRGGKGDGEAGAVSRRTGDGEFVLLPDFGEFRVKDNRTVGKALAGHRAAVDGDLPAADHGAERHFAQVAAGVENKRLTHKRDSLHVDRNDTGTGKRLSGCQQRG